MDAGTDVGLPFCGQAPDLGAFELVSPYGPADLDQDCGVDVDDFVIFESCLGGPGQLSPPPGCDPSHFEAADLDGDGNADLADVARFLNFFSGD